MIIIDDFKKLGIKISKVVLADKVVDTDKLMNFVVDVGTEQRQILAGMAEFFSNPSVLIVKEIPLLLNIIPRTFKSQTSYGMIVAVHVRQADTSP